MRRLWSHRPFRAAEAQGLAARRPVKRTRAVAARGVVKAVALGLELPMKLPGGLPAAPVREPPTKRPAALAAGQAPARRKKRPAASVAIPSQAAVP